jgi:hypothetical protein
MSDFEGEQRVNVILRWYLRQILAKPILRSIEWTEEERNSFDLFCRSKCGIKLFEFLRQIVANATFCAVYQNSVSANARARGMQDVLAVLHRLRVFPELQEESSTSLADSEIPEPPSRARSTDDWPWVQGGRGAIG